MEFLRIGENQLKITLSEEELLFYGLDLSSLSYSSTETRRGFWALLDDAKHATGFDAAATRVSVQIYASREGGCEMYIFAASAQIDNDGKDEDPSSLSMESGLTVCPSVPKVFSPAVGAFERLCDLLSACLALYNNGYMGESSAWQIGGRYYLCLSGNLPPSEQRKNSKGSLDATGVLWEFATHTKEITLPHLAEHGIPLCPMDAVEKLSRVAT